MKVVGLITEYNPLHNGHQYHIEQAKKLTGADRVIVVMSGDFVQRGEPAIMSKHLRAKAALTCGASAVFELPVRYATGSAEAFASGAIELLNRLHIIDYICFGSECADISELSTIAQILADEPQNYLTILKQDLQNGLSFPAARANAVASFSGNTKYADLLNQPNNILGIEYLKALIVAKSNMKPFTIKREGAGYHDSDMDVQLASASAIRNYLQNKNISAFHGDTQFLSQIPEACHKIMIDQYEKSYPVYLNTFSFLLKYALLSHRSFDQFQDVSAELSNRILRERNHYQNFNQFCELLKTKELTYTRISRALLHIMLQITKKDIKNNHIYYAHLLGFRTDASDVLTKIKQLSSIPLLTKLASVSFTEEAASEMFQEDCFAADLYQSAITELYKTPFVNEMSQQIIRI